jgi:hypothetical protein
VTTIEFDDRYTGTPMEHRPWLRGCFGDCEALGYFPEPDPRRWPIMTRPWPSDPSVGDERVDFQTGLRFYFTGPGWDPRGGARLDEPDDAEWRAAVVERGWWVPRSAKDDGWAFLKCPECNGTGTVGYRKGLSRLPYLWRRMASGVRRADGAEGWSPDVSHPVARTRWFYFAHGAGETWRAITWRAPEELR